MRRVYRPFSGGALIARQRRSAGIKRRGERGNPITAADVSARARAIHGNQVSARGPLARTSVNNPGRRDARRTEPGAEKDGNRTEKRRRFDRRFTRGRFRVAIDWSRGFSGNFLSLAESLQFYDCYPLYPENRGEVLRRAALNTLRTPVSLEAERKFQELGGR